MSLQRKLNVKIFLVFIVAENTGSVNIPIWGVKRKRNLCVNLTWISTWGMKWSLVCPSVCLNRQHEGVETKRSLSDCLSYMHSNMRIEKSSVRLSFIPLMSRYAFFDIKNSNSWYQKIFIISWYLLIEFLISKNLFLYIKNSISRYQEIEFLISKNISWYKKIFISWYQESISWYQEMLNK